MHFNQHPSHNIQALRHLPPLRDVPRHLRAEQTIYRPRFRHAEGAQTGAMVKPLLSALIGLGILAAIVATAPHWPKWQEQIHTSFIETSAKNGYVVQNVQVTGRDRVPAKDLLATLDIQRGMPIFAYDPHAAQERVAQLTGVESVFIERRWPNTVFIRLSERQPAVRWQKNEVVTLIDAKGGVVAQKDTDDVNQYPILIGDNVTAQIVPLFQLLQGQPDLLKEVKAATWVGQRRWDLTLHNGAVVKLPAQNAPLAIAQLMKLVKEQNIFDKDLEIVDLRLPGQAILRPTKRADLMIQRPDFTDPADTSKKNI
jgi:cell division septal protein FtsQ